MRKKKELNGRTFADLISEYPKTFITSLILLFLVILIIVFSGKHVKIGSFEINGGGEVIKDTIVKVDTVLTTVYDTLVVEKKPPATKFKRQEVVIKENDKNEVIVKNQPTNINTGTNNGIIGDNATLNNFGEKPHVLTENSKKGLIKLLDIEIQKPSKNVKSLIVVSGIMGNKRSLDLAEKIQTFLISKNYNVNPSIGLFTSGRSSNSINISANENYIAVDVDMY